MNSETAIVATRIADCIVLAVPDDLGEQRLRELEDVARQCVATAAPRSIVFDMSAVKYADVSEFRELIALTDMAAILGVQPLLVGLSPGIIMHWVDAGVDTGRVRTFLDLADALTALGLTVDRTRT